MSGMLPAEVIEQHHRTVKNAVYQSDSESYESSFQEDDTMNSESVVHGLNHNIPSISPSVSHFDSDRLTSSWKPFYSGFRKDSIFPSLHTQLRSMPPKNITQSSMPCVWSYGKQRTNGITPHHTSHFFYRLKQFARSNANHSKNGSRLKFNNSKSRAHFSSQSSFPSQLHESNDRPDVLHGEQGQHHSLFNQFLLQKDSRFQDWAKGKEYDVKYQKKKNGMIYSLKHTRAYTHTLCTHAHTMHTHTHTNSRLPCALLATNLNIVTWPDNILEII